MSSRPLVPNLDAGETPARVAEVCSHGREGYCYDDASPAEREAVDFVHRHAYDYAVGGGVDHDTAEAYAAYAVWLAWHPGAVSLDGSHSRDFAEFLSVQDPAEPGC